MTEVPLFEAKCAACGHVFDCPSFGDFAYGLVVLCTPDRKHYRSVDAFDAFAQRVARHVESGAVWHALADLADPVEGAPLTTDERCPSCGSPALERGEDAIVGSMAVVPATFVIGSSLDESTLAERVRRVSERG